MKLMVDYYTIIFFICQNAFHNLIMTLKSSINKAYYVLSPQQLKYTLSSLGSAHKTTLRSQALILDKNPIYYDIFCAI